jgi:Glycosyl hydrolase catalytic core
MRRLLASLVLLASLLALPAASQAYSIAIGDQQPTMFSDPLFKQLGIKKARYIVSYDVVKAGGDELARTDTWLRAARAQGIEPLVSFSHRRNDDCLSSRSPSKCHLPSISEYTADLKRFKQRYTWVNVISPWNEANHQSQPTYAKPKAAAGLYEAARKVYPKATIVGLDVLDTTKIAATVRYVKAFQKAVKHMPTIWGLHNYSDTNRFRNEGTKAILAAVKGQVWLTETGGVVHFGKSFPYDPARAAKAIKYMFKLAASNPRVKRLYIYQWSGADPKARFDAGLMSASGTPRPGYDAVRRQLRK